MPLSTKVGQVLSVRIDDVVPGAFGTTYVGMRSTPLNERLGVTAAPTVHAWDLDPVAGVGRNQAGHSVALRPFLGVMGVAVAGSERPHSVPPGRHGGNGRGPVLGPQGGSGVRRGHARSLPRPARAQATNTQKMCPSGLA